MSKHKKRKEKLFDIYSKNLTWVKEHPSITFKPDFTDGYICPLCFNVFTKDALDEKSLNPLTYDHNPPKSLGGKQGILTCKECNSKLGHKIDNQLLKRLEELDFISFQPNSSMRTTLEANDNIVTSDISIDGKGEFKINIDRKNSNPVHSNNFMAEMRESYSEFNPFNGDLEALKTWEMNFTMNVHERSNERFAEIALLKIAYLFAFQKFGHGFLINSSLYKIREQILNPDKEILPKVFWIKFPFPENAVGLNIIDSPEELKCFLIIFNLYTKSRKWQFAVALPGTSSPNLEIYNNIENILCQDKIGSTKANFVHLYDRDYVMEKKWAFSSHQQWKNIASR